MSKDLLPEIKRIYNTISDKIITRLQDFRNTWQQGTDESIFLELVFCLLTPQSKANCCWDAVECMLDKDLLYTARPERLSDELNRVRFKHTKARRIVEVRNKFLTKNKFSVKQRLSEFDDPIKMRKWLVDNIKGLGYKEASHFLRNIGFGEKLAILDRHILRNLVSFGVINEIPKSLSPSKYLEIEEKMKRFAEEINIPLAHLDILLWYKETGYIFK
ncbi:N-glycosylase/DNA lyase [bacterium]|nr:N-glycosylase/DNA lyase [bacterium]